MDMYTIFKSIKERDLNTLLSIRIEKSKNLQRKVMPVKTNHTTYTNDLYNRIYLGLLNLDTSIELDGHYESCDQIDQTYQKVTRDHPELFYAPYKYNLFFYKDSDDLSVLKVEYPYSMKDIHRYETELDRIKEDYLKQIKGLSYEQIIDYTYQYTIDLLEYDHKDKGNNPNKDPNTYNIIGAFFEHTCVCAGYAKTFQYLMQAAGYSCEYISGQGKGEKHAWNSLEIQGKKYYYDTTWDDNRPQRKYYQLNYQQISKDHRFIRDVH